MHQCNRNCKICSITNDNFVASNVQAELENENSPGPSGMQCVTEKSQLEKILETVSMLCPSNSTGTDRNNSDDDCAIVNSDSDEIEIVDVVVNGNHAKKVSSNEIDNVNPANNQLEKCSKSSVNAIDSANMQEAQNITKNDILENITDSVDIQVVQNVNDTSEKATNSVTIEESQSINEMYICKSEEIVLDDIPKNDICEVPTSEHAGSTESISMICSQTDIVSAVNTMNGCDLNSNSPEKCVIKNILDTVEAREHESLDDNAVGDENMDVQDETGEYCSYEIEYDFTSGPPSQITGTFEYSVGKKNNYTRGCKWAPDGSCIMTCSNDNKLRIFNLPYQLWDLSKLTDWTEMTKMDAVLKISEGDLIYDYCWYPLMNSSDPATCCFVSTSRKNTVHMWDAYSGELRCSYRSFDHLDELVTPHSLCFDSDGEKLFCGYHNAIRVFDVNRPGRTCEERQIYSHKSGQYGIISCFAFTSADKNISAAGSYQKSIGLYAEPYGELSCLLEGQGNGVTQLQFSPDGKYLYSGGRKDPEILCWDIRSLGKVLFSMRRACDTNQRMHFDISRCGKYVVSGNQNGVITFWDVTTEPKEIEKSYFPVLVPVQYYLAHQDSVNGVGFHPYHPILCSSSGQRKFPVLLDDDSEDVFSYDMEKQDNSLRLWWIGKPIK